MSYCDLCDGTGTTTDYGTDELGYVDYRNEGELVPCPAGCVPPETVDDLTETERAIVTRMGQGAGVVSFLTAGVFS